MAVKIEVKGPIVSNDMADVYHYFGWDACGPKDISEKLNEAAGDDVILEINSPGGVCAYGYEMYKALMDYQGKVTAHVIMAASAASLLVCAATEALASDACIFMIHNTKSGVSGDYREFENGAEMLREYNEGIINVYVRKTGKSREELQNMMDAETYMSAQTAIENGFIDGYLYGNPNENDSGEEGEKANAMLQVMNAALPVMSEEKAREVMGILKMKNENGVGIRHRDEEAVQNNSDNADSEINKSDEKGEKKIMNLKEAFAEHPELEAEVNALVHGAQEEGEEKERQRLQALDAIAQSVTAESLQDAKYGENRMDAKELAYQSMLEDGKKAENYMKSAMNDAEKAGVNEVGAGCEEETTDEAEEMAAYVNARKGGK